MDKILEKQLAEVFEQDYQGYEYFVKNVVNKVFTGDDTYEALPVPENILDDTNKKVANNAGILQILKIGSIDAIEGIDVYDITLRDNKQLQYNRVGIQQLIRSQQIFYSNAFLLFHNEHPEEKEWRFSFFYKQGKSKDTTSAKRFTYLFGKNFRARTASERFARLAEREKDTDNLLDAFSVEALSKEFFDKYREHYADIVEYITGKRYVKEKGKWVEKTIHEPCHEIFDQFAVSFTNPEKTVRDYIKKLLGRLVFLQFLQKKGWMGVPVDRTDWTGGDTRFLQNKFNEFEDKDNFIDGFLEPLFNDLNTNRQNLGDRASKAVGVDIKIPFLNGGLFQLDEEDCTNVRLPQHLLGDVIDFFEQYNFTIDENDPNDAQIGVDPEMLGRVFENLLEDNKDKGAFYTPKEIVQYMCQESLIAYLQTGIDNENVKESIRQFVLTHEVDYLGSMAEDINIKLLNVKICDPAIGSGAFPMGLLRQLYLCQCAIHPELEERNSADIKRHIIQNNIYGVDIEKGAVDIARLRFWLSLIVDEETPRFLPNLDFKIMQGNSLLEQYKGVDLSKMTELKKEKLEGTQLSMFEDMLDVLRLDLRKKLNEYYDCSDHHRKEHLKQEIIDNVKQQLREQSIYVDFGDLDLSANDQFTLWHTWFYDVFSQGGFDIVIGNPPYGLINKKQNQGDGVIVDPVILKQYKELKRYFPAQGGMLNIFRLFIVQSVYLLKEKGVFSEIFPLAFTCDVSASKCRSFVLSECSMITLEAFPERDNPQKRVFESAKMSVCILVMYKFSNPYCSFKLRINRERYVETEKQPGVLNYRDLRKMDSKYLTIPLSESWDMDIVKKVFSISVNFGTIGKCNTGEIDMTFCKGAFTTDESDIKMIRGANLNRYVVKETMSQGEVFHLNKERLLAIKKLDDDLFSTPRIVMQGITGVNERVRLKMAISKNVLCANSVNYLSFNSNVNVLFMLGLLNSKLLNYVFKQFSTNSNVNGYEVDNLPILNATEEKQRAISTLVKDILVLKEREELSDTSNLEKQIDLFVYQLYGLTYDEVLIVDPETPITREEYEND
ncbi:MAG: Eco57I restriction-modification methylase domain-containing protein [Prevotella sp.]|nr:Eco57I restriction-modification methylase domain-containing protein [Prevotella sp.]